MDLYTYLWLILAGAIVLALLIKAYMHYGMPKTKKPSAAE